MALTVVMGLGIVYLGHELGHVLAAKACRLKLARYYFGFETAADPRNFAVKPVWQRVVIILAGALMNLLLAVAFTAVAYRYGLSYTPCVIGGTAPGAPAWELGLQSGDKILQIGRSGKPNEHLRFYKDLLPAVVLHGSATEMELLIRRHGLRQPQWVAIQPSAVPSDLGQRAIIGVRPPNTTKLSDVWRADNDRWADAGHQALLAGDQIVAVNQGPLPRDEQTGEILSHHLEAAFAQHMTEPFTLTVERRVDPGENGAASSTRQFDVILPPTKMRVLGLAMQIGPVVQVRTGSPAHEAGFRPGDVLVAINGKDVGDPMTLAQRLLPLIGEDIGVGVERDDDDEPVILRVTPQAPATHEGSFGPGSPLALESLGLALRVANVVQSVDPDGPAFEAGLQAGDEIAEIRFLATDAAQREKMIALFGRQFDRWVELSDESPNWVYIHNLLQASITGTEVEVTYYQQDVAYTAQIAPTESDIWLHADRGLTFAGLSQVYSAESWTEALALGVHDTRETLGDVLVVLHRLVTGRFQRTSLGGPVKIAAVGTAESSEGLPRLLVFLAYVSINYAVFCCLPIPGLDGGHLLFLAIEGITRKPVGRTVQLILIAISLVGFLFLLCSLVLPCLSQLLRLIGLIRVKKAARSDGL